MELFFYKTTPGHELLNITTSGAAVCNVDTTQSRISHICNEVQRAYWKKSWVSCPSVEVHVVTWTSEDY
jgi:hypothetical protein